MAKILSGVFFSARSLCHCLKLTVCHCIFAVGGGLSMLVPNHMVMVVVILTITTLGILASLIPAVNRIDKTFESGMYLILIFSIVVASMADVRNLPA
jgi:hypothetical protein